MTKPSKHHPRTATRELIAHMLKQRKQVLVLLWELSRQDWRQVDEASHEMLDEFLSLLVDYIASGHFGLYQRIAEGNERRESVFRMAQSIYPRIAATTDAAVAFSERYENASARGVGEKPAADLSSLAEGLILRIELEDQLIKAMMGEDFVIADA